jgi:hypothetical protein
MTSSFTVLASAHTASHSTIPSPLTIVLVVAAIGYVLWSRMQGRPLKIRRLLLLPAVLTVLGFVDLTGSSAPHLTPKDITFLAISAAVSAALGAARGATIELYPSNGVLWQRYRPVTVVLWVTLIVVKIVLLVIADAAGASAGAGTSTLLLFLGVSLLAEAAIVIPRAQATGVPFAARYSNAQDRPSQPGAEDQDPAVPSPSPTLAYDGRESRHDHHDHHDHDHHHNHHGLTGPS